MTTFQGQSAKRHSNKKNFKSGQNQRNAIFIFITFRNHRQKGHRNLESQQNDNISRSVCATPLKQEKLQNRSKSTKCYIHFHNFPESSAKNFNVVSHLQVSQIPKIKSKKGTGAWNSSRMTTFQGQSAKRHSNKKNFKSGQNQAKARFIFITFRNHRQKILMLFHIYKSRTFRKSNQNRAPELGIPTEWQHSKVSRRNVIQTWKTSKAIKINQMLYSFS